MEFILIVFIFRIYRRHLKCIMHMNWFDPHGTHILKKVKSLWIQMNSESHAECEMNRSLFKLVFFFPWVENNSDSIQFMYPSFISAFWKTCKAFWVVPLEVTGFCMYPSAHGRTASLRLKVRSVRLIPITSPNIRGADTRHGSSTAKVTWLWISSTGLMHSESLQEKRNQSDHHVIYTVIIRSRLWSNGRITK